MFFWKIRPSLKAPAQPASEAFLAPAPSAVAQNPALAAVAPPLKIVDHRLVESPEPIPRPMTKPILIVEDNELNMKLFHDLLEAHGYKTVGPRNGLEGRDIPAESRPEWRPLAI